MSPQCRRVRVLRPLLALTAVLVVATSSTGQTARTWTGNTGNWSVGSNWQGGTAPNPTDPSSNALTFIGPGGYTATDNFSGAFAITTLSSGVLSSTVTLNMSSGTAVLAFQSSGATGPSIDFNSNVGFNFNVQIPVSVSAAGLTVTGSGAGTLRFGFGGSSTGKVSGAGGLTINSVGDVLLYNPANDYAGGTVLNSGGLGIGNTTGTTPLGTGGLTINGGRLRASVTADSTFTTPVLVGGNFALGHDPSGANGDGSTTLTVGGTVNLGGAVRTITVTGGTTNAPQGITGAISNGGIVKAGPSALLLDNTTSSFSGGLTVNAGTVQAVAVRSLGSLANQVTLATGTTLELRNNAATNYANPLAVSGSGAAATVNVNRVSSGTGNTLSLGDLSMAGGQTLTVAGGNSYSLGVTSVNLTGATAPTFNPTTADLKIADGITGNGGFIKTGAGTLTLNTGTTSLTGAVQVNAGTLRVENGLGFSATGTGAVTVASTATLSGVGLIAPTGPAPGVTVSGTLAPSGTRALTGGTNLYIGNGDHAGSVQLNSGAKWEVDLAPSGSFTPAAANTGGSSTGSNNGLLWVLGAGSSLTVLSPSSLKVKVIGDASLFTPGTYSFLVGRADSVTAFSITAQSQFDTTGFTNYTGGSFSLVEGTGTLGNEVYLNFTPVPEPSGVLVVAAFAWAGLARLRRLATGARAAIPA